MRPFNNMGRRGVGRVVDWLARGIMAVGTWITDRGYALEHRGRCFQCGDITPHKLCHGCLRTQGVPETWGMQDHPEAWRPRA